MTSKDLEKHYEQEIEHVIENNKNMRFLRKKYGRKEIIAIKDNEGNEIRDRNTNLEITEKFYKRLYSIQIETPKYAVKHPEIIDVGSEDILEISVQEIVYAIQSMNRGKAQGDDNIIIDMLYEAREIVLPKLKTRLNICLDP